MKKILIVEDDRLLNKTLSYNLQLEGYGLTSVFSSDSAWRELTSENYSLVLLDINLPDGSGISLCEKIKQYGIETYVIFITADSKECDMLKGYNAGAFDYITKPFSIRVLMKKISVLFDNIGLQGKRSDYYQDGYLRIDFSAMTSSIEGKAIEFTPKEYQLLLIFIKNADLILSKNQLIEKLWGTEKGGVDEHTLATIISRIRGKIESKNHRYIKTAYGIGYKWTDGEQDEVK